MVTSLDFYKHYGDPASQKFKDAHMVIWDVPTELEIGFIPKKIYCNKDIIPVLSAGFKNLIDTGHVEELLTWDGCWNFRPMRGVEDKYKQAEDKGDFLAAARYLSVHSWGCAVDMNASLNPLGAVPKFSPEFVNCFVKAGMDWGGYFKRLDGMHFQLAALPQ